jgi:hypothetical protein
MVSAKIENEMSLSCPERKRNEQLKKNNINKQVSECPECVPNQRGK